MFKYICVIFSVFACVAAKPGLIGAPLLAAPAPVITATSSQIVARTFNGIAHAPIVAPIAPVHRFVAPVSPIATAGRLIAPAAYATPFVPAPAPLARVVAPFSPVAPIPALHSAPVFARHAAAYPAVHPAPLLARYAATAPLAYRNHLGLPAPIAYAPSFGANYIL